ncbi:MAG: hypothetical protein JXD19_04800 [Deltaproteobacteria bacterium]|nr:hypothetical protein [Deltaproteobacteria bacterium]
MRPRKSHFLKVFIIESVAFKNEIGWDRIMESVELKLRGLNGEFPVVYTKKIVEILGEPELSIEVQAGQTSEDESRLLESLDYHITVKKDMDGWLLLKAVKRKK